MGIFRFLVLAAVLLIVVGSLLRRFGKARSNPRITRWGTMAFVLLVLPVGLGVWFGLLQPYANA